METTFIFPTLHLIFQFLTVHENNKFKHTYSDMIFFSNAYTHDFYRALGITTSLLNFLVLTPLLYSIVWYERFGSDHPRTLINQLVASTCWNGIVHNIVNIPLSIFIDTFGPMSYQFCRFNFVIKNSIIFHLVLMVQFIILAKYFSIFVLKNPTELYNEFWCFYLNILCLVLALVFQTAFIVLPGKNPLDFSICTGKKPSELNTNYQKVNFSLQIIAVLCVALYIMVCLRVKMFSQKSVHLLGQCFPTRVQGKPWVPWEAIRGSAIFLSICH